MSPFVLDSFVLDGAVQLLLSLITVPILSLTIQVSCYNIFTTLLNMMMEAVPLQAYQNVFHRILIYKGKSVLVLNQKCLRK